MSRADAVDNLRAPAGSLEQRATRAVFLVAGLAMATWAPLVPFAKARLEIEEGTLGLLLLCLGLGSIVAMPITGVLATRFGCRAVALASGVILALTLPFLAIAATPLALATVLVIFGASVGTLDVTMNIQAVIVEKDSARPMMSGFHGLFSLGGIIGAGGVSALLAFGLSPVYAAILVSVLALIVLAASAKGLLPYGNAETGDAPLFVLPRGFIVLIGALCFLVFLAEGAVLDWSAVFLTEIRSFTPAKAGWGYAVFAIAMTGGRLLGDRILAALGGQRILLFGGFLAGLGFALIIASPLQWTALAGFFLVGAGASNVVPVLFTVAGRQKDMPVSLAIASITTLGYGGVLAGPALIGFVAHLSSLAVSFGLLAIAMLLISANSWVSRR
ncbi:MAG: MFS transporter [Hyphomicrobiales bacterium]|nr:MFS transporter [Hyphomicrobiales bacterium]